MIFESPFAAYYTYGGDAAIGSRFLCAGKTSAHLLGYFSR
jgi:hypothetical protein